MTRGWSEALFLAGTAAVAALTVTSVRPADLGAFSAGVLGPLAVVGAAVCVLSWPPRFHESEAGCDEDRPAADGGPALADGSTARRRPWRWVYLSPAVVTAVVAPVLVAGRFAGLPPVGAVALLLFLAYLAMLLGVAAFLVVLLPLGQLVGWWRARLEGRRTSPYVPLGALLILSLVAVGGCTGAAFDDLPTGPFGLVLAVLGLAGIRPASVVVAHPAWLLAARVSVLVLVAVVVGLVVEGRRAGGADETLR